MRAGFKKASRFSGSTEGSRKPKAPILDAAWRLLAIRLRTRHELHERLLGKGYLEEDVAACLARLTELGSVNDGVIAKYWTESKADRQHLGKRRVREALRQRGVPRDIVEAAVGQMDPESEVSRAEAAARQAWKRLARLPRETARRRLYGALSRKGFEHEIIMKIMGSAMLGEGFREPSSRRS